MADVDKLMLTKIVATVGPGCLQPEILIRLIEEGVRVFRINFSHGELEDFAGALKMIREAEIQAGVPVGVLGDLCGPKIRVGEVVVGGVELKKGDVIGFVESEITGGQRDDNDEILFSTNWQPMVQQVQVGQRLLIDDGSVRALVVEKLDNGAGRKLIAHVVVGGVVTSHKGINLPDTDLSVPSITDWDWACARWAMENSLDYVALSFVRSGNDIRELKQGMARFAQEAKANMPSFLNPDQSGGTEDVPPECQGIPVIAKIEKPGAIDQLQAIVEQSDAVMVARGDLGVEMDLWEVPVIQKRVIHLAHEYGRQVIVATQMLQSMIDNPVPTRAEVSDVANAIFDGVDAVMLSGETAVGKYPVQSVAMMGCTARSAEANVDLDPGYARLMRNRVKCETRGTAALMHGVGEMVRDLEAKLVVMWSQTGGGARLLSQRRLKVPIVAFSSEKCAVGKMSLMYGVQPRVMQWPGGIEAFLETVNGMVLENGWARRGDMMLVVLGEPIDEPGSTNHVSVHQVK